MQTFLRALRLYAMVAWVGGLTFFAFVVAPVAFGDTTRGHRFLSKGEIKELKSLMKRSTEQGMQTLDQALYVLYQEGAISYRDALAYADSANDLRLMIKLEKGAGSETSADLSLNPE